MILFMAVGFQPRTTETPDTAVVGMCRIVWPSRHHVGVGCRGPCRCSGSGQVRTFEDEFQAMRLSGLKTLAVLNFLQLAVGSYTQKRLGTLSFA